MKMVLDNALGLNLVTAYEAGELKIRNNIFHDSMIIYPQKVSEWSISDVSGLDSKAFRGIAQEKPELLILGTGLKQKFPHPRVFIPLMDAGIGYEVMDNAAACRTFNILIGEGRIAALAIIQ